MVVVVAIVGAAVAIAAEGGDGITHRVGVNPQFGHVDDSEIVVFQPWQGSDHPTVNVEPSFAGEHLFDEYNRWRVLRGMTLSGSSENQQCF